MKNIAMVMLLTVFLVSCESTPTTRGSNSIKPMSAKESSKIGLRSHRSLINKELLYSDENLYSYLDGIVNNLSTKSGLKIRDVKLYLIDSPIPNLIVSPGAYAYVSRGLLNYLSSESQVAAILADMLAGIAKKHAETMHSHRSRSALHANILGSLTGLASSAALDLVAIKSLEKKQRSERYRLAANMLRKSGYNPNALKEAYLQIRRVGEFSKELGESASEILGFQARSLMSDESLEEIEVALLESKAGASDSPSDNSQIFLAETGGLPFGYSKYQGKVIGQYYVHPISNIKVAYPIGWAPALAGRRFSAVPNDSSDNIYEFGVRVLKIPSNMTLEEFYEEKYQLDVTFSNPKTNVYLQNISAAQKKSKFFNARISVVKLNNYLVEISALSKEILHDDEVLKFSDGVAIASEDDLQGATFSRFSTITVTEEIGFESFVRRFSTTQHSSQLLRLINGMPAEGPVNLAPGSMLKLLE